MATYVNNLRLTEITTGDESGTWGTTTNSNWDFATDAFGYGVKNMAADADQTFTMADGSVDTLRSMYLKITSTVAPLTATRTLTIAPNTVSKLWVIENATTGSQSIKIKQGSGAEITIATGTKTMLYTDGAGAGAAVFNAAPTAATSGTVTSVAASVPSIFSIAGSPITTSGTLAMTYSGTALPVANGGTGATTLTANYVLLGNGTSAPQMIAPSSSGNVLTSNGTTWASSAPAAGGITYTTTKTTTYTAVANDGVLTNTTGGAFTVNLPASPTNGQQVIIADAGGTWGTNNLTVGRNGNYIADVAQDLVCDISGVSVQFVYNSSGTATWEVYAQVGGNGGTVVTLDGTQTLTNKTLTAPTIASANLTTALTLAGAAGTNGQVLTSAGSGLPSWTTVANSAAEVSSAVNVTLTSASDDIQAIAMTVADKSVTLPSATTLTAGTNFIIKNTGTLNYAVRKNGGLFLATLRPNQIAIFYCTNIGTTAGTWAVGDETVGDMLNSIYAQTAVTIASVAGDAQTGVCALSATQAVAVFRGTSNYLNACTLNLDSSNVLTAGTILVVNAVSSSSMAVTAMSSTQAIVVYAGTSTYLEARTLNVSGTTVTSGALLVVNATGTTEQSITTMSSTQAIVVYSGVSNFPEACTLNVSGTTITNGTVVQINGNSSSSMAVATASATVAFCAYRDSSTFPAYARLTVSGTSITVNDVGAVGDSECSLVRIANIDSTTSAVFWRSTLVGDNNSLMARVINNASGSNYNRGGVVTLPFAPTSQMYATKIKNNKIMIFTNSNNAQYPVSIYLTVKDGFSIATDTAITPNSMVAFRNSVARFSDSLAVVVYVGTSDYKYANVIEITP